MPTSLRARLSLWNAAAFAVLLGASGAGVYAFVAATVEARTDTYLAQTATALGEALSEALDDARTAPPGEAGKTADETAAGVVRRFHFRDIGVAVFEAGGTAPPRLLAATRPDGSEPRAGVAAAYPFGGPWGLGPAADVAARAVREGTVTASLGEGPSAERVAAVTRPADAPGRVLVAAASQSLGTQHEVLRETREALVAGVLLLLGVAGAGGYAVAWRSLAPIEEMSRRAAHIEAGTLHERLPARGEATELARLAAAFNGLLARVEVAVAQQRQFMADASHELRTPVAIVRGEAELALAHASRPEEEYRAALATVGAQADALTRLVDDLFLLARAGAGERAAAPAPLYLEELAESCVRAVRTLAQARGVTLAFTPDAELPVHGDARLLQRALLNLLDNAIKYTPRGGAVRITVARLDGESTTDANDAARDEQGERTPAEGGSVPPLARLLDTGWMGEPPAAAPMPVAARAARPWGRVTVTDTGPGIAPDAQPHVFERFYRARRAVEGPADRGGAGLGLAIVEWVAQEQGGRVVLVRSDGRGTEFAFELPLREEG